MNKNNNMLNIVLHKVNKRLTISIIGLLCITGCGTKESNSIGKEQMDEFTPIMQENTSYDVSDKNNNIQDIINKQMKENSEIADSIDSTNVKSIYYDTEYDILEEDYNKINSSMINLASYDGEALRQIVFGIKELELSNDLSNVEYIGSNNLWEKATWDKTDKIYVIKITIDNKEFDFWSIDNTLYFKEIYDE